jgi:hypothetical protein
MKKLLFLLEYESNFTCTRISPTMSLNTAMPSCEKKNQLVHQDGRVDLVDMYCSRASRKHRFCFTTQKTFSCLFVSFCFIRLKAGRAFIIVQLRGGCVAALLSHCCHSICIRPPALTPVLPSTRLRLVTAGSVGSASAPLFVLRAGECTVVRLQK